MLHTHYMRSGASSHRLYFFMMPTATSFDLVIRRLPSAIKSSLVDADTFSQLASEPWEEETVPNVLDKHPKVYFTCMAAS